MGHITVNNFQPLDMPVYSSIVQRFQKLCIILQCNQGEEHTLSKQFIALMWTICKTNLPLLCYRSAPSKLPVENATRAKIIIQMLCTRIYQLVHRLYRHLVHRNTIIIQYFMMYLKSNYFWVNQCRIQCYITI